MAVPALLAATRGVSTKFHFMSPFISRPCWHVASFLFFVALAGCASAPPPAKPVSAPAAVFYPTPPDPPRIQYLATFTGERDFAVKLDGFAQFIAGDEQGKGRTLVTLYGIALFDGRIYAVDSKAAKIAIFDLVKQQFRLLTGAGAGRLQLPINITVDADGTKYVTDTGRNQVLVYDRDDTYQRAYGEKEQFRPVDTAINGDRLYVIDILHHEVQVLNKRTGKLLFKFGQAGPKEGTLFQPTNIAIDANGDVLVADTGNFRVQRFNAEGKPLRVFGEVGDTPGTFARPKGIAVDRAGRIYVGDAAFQNVQVFEGDGKLLMAFGQPEKGAGMSLPAAVKIDYDNVALFKRYADPKFNIEYVILVTSQVAPNKIDVFGFGRMAGADYSRDTVPR